ncbi:hypothetical protein DFH94DRAFT_209695 [Russula ochroleuca]|uniref:RNA polymerase II-associated protein 3 n=1 Tax=Russula ochroleuca TaxID=152965 RepID=A0A9P5JZ45_9AGAM|nr:hypothetical protein DFH94DRAFT_209695 [Russula ochroleuca]
MSSSSTTSKEKGNAAFKSGDYAAAIGHYTAAALADPSEPTFFLNRAAAYLKLSKNEDAERDCTTVLGLSNNKNVKAFFRRAQARAALEKLGEAHNDLQRALKLEPSNEAVKAELARVDELIVNRKGKTRSAPIGLSVPAPPPAPSPSPTTPPKRRRVPITIVDNDNNHPPVVTQSTGDGDDLLLNPISSRRVLQPSPDGKSAPITPAPAPVAPKPTPASFREAKQVREAKSAGRVGGGIFRMSGNDTVFETRDVPASAAVADHPPKDPAPTPASTHTAPAATRAPSAAPRTLFEFTRAWDSIPSSDTATRWALLNSIHPTSLPALFGASLEPALLASLVSVLAGASANTDNITSRDAVRAVMCSLARVSRFRTVVQFLSRAERDAARAAWEAVVQGDGGDGEVEEAARLWGFTDP